MISVVRIVCAVFAFLVAPVPPLAADDSEDLRKTIDQLRQVIASQQKLIEDLQARVRVLEGKDEQFPPAQEPAPERPSAVSGPAPSTFMPDLAVIGNHRGTFLVPKGYEARNRFQLGELELALQQPIYTGMNFYATLAGGADAGFNMGVEEAYVTLSRPFKLPFDGTVGKRRLQFGKVNPMHPHQWRYVDMPAPLTAFLGEEGFFGNGASLNYTIPAPGLFANLELGLWGPTSAHAHEHVPEEESSDDGDHHHGHVGTGIASDMPVARLWLSKELGQSGEIELGASHAWGKADAGDPIRLGGLDFTYRLFPSTFSRLQLQGELVWQRRKERPDNTWHTRIGHYLFLSYSPDKYYEYGLRFDNTGYPWPLEGREQSLSFIVTNRLSEATLVRLQYKVGDRTSGVLLPARKGFSEVFLQFIWGAGSHKHPLQ